MENFLTLPSSREDDAIVNLADWVELSAFFSAKRTCSKEDLRVAIQRAPQENDESPTLRRVSDDVAEAKANDVFSELNDRAMSCAAENGLSTYPFTVDDGQSLLRMSADSVDSSTLVYFFLLAITVASMASTARKRAGHDPTKLFERLCADVLRSFWGGGSKHSDVMIFGTAKASKAREKKFKTNIETLCKYLNEGSGWNPDAIAPGGGDGSLDLVAWRRFQDSRQGGLVGFAQCKTGVHWSNHVTELVPSAFSRDFMKKQLVLDPFRMYMVPSRVSRHRWVGVLGKAGLLFDRCRIVQYANDVDAQVLSDCKKWLDAVFGEQSVLMRRLVA